MRCLNPKQTLWAYLNQRKKQSLMIVFFGMLTQLLTMIIPVSIGKYYQLAFGMSGRRVEFMDFVPPTWWDTVPEFLLIFMLLIIGRYAFFFVYQYRLNQAGQEFVKVIKDDLFARQLTVDYAVYRDKGVGKYLLRYSGDLNSLRNLYVKGGLSVASDIFILIVAFAWFFALSVLGAVIVLLGSALSFVVIYWLTRRVEFYSLQKRDKTAGQLSFVSRTLQSILTVMVFNKQDIELKKYRKRSADIVIAAADYNRWLVANNGFIAFIQYAVLTLVLYVFYQSHNQGNTNINGAHLISFVLLYITILPVIRRLFRLPTVYQLAGLSLAKLDNIYQLPTENTNVGETIYPTLSDFTLAFKQVSFGDGVVKLELISDNQYRLYRPKTLAFQTLAYALTGLTEQPAYTGRIEVNGLALERYSTQSRRAQISLLSAEVPLLGRTVYEAITIKRTKGDRANSAQHLEKVQLILGIARHEQLSLADKIGENGSSLSAVQYQMLCLVRGLNTQKAILLCDRFALLPQNAYTQLIDEQNKISIRCW